MIDHTEQVYEDISKEQHSYRKEKAAMETIPQYPKMKYASDRRDWIRYADKELPQMLEKAIECQLAAKETFEAAQKYPLHNWMRKIGIAHVAEVSAEGRRYLFRAIYLQAMRNANYFEEDWS